MFMSSLPCHRTHLCSTITSVFTDMCKQQALLKVKDI